jgi:hypothetical protein
MMEANKATEKAGRTFDSAYGFSFSIAIGLILFIAGLLIVLTIGQGAMIGLIFGIPLLLTGLVLPVFMMRDLFRKSDVIGNCPYCSTELRTSDATLRLRCTACNGVVGVRDGTFFKIEQS